MWANISSSATSVTGGQNGSAATGGKSNQSEDPQIEDDAINNKSNEKQFGSPLMRYKHAVCSSTTSGLVYIHGGRFGGAAIEDDVWRFDPHHNSWTQLQTYGSKPPSLQEHTLVEYENQLYLFGGQLRTASDETPFWRLNLDTCEWRSLNVKSSRSFGAHLGPTNRRGHSAVIYGNSMYVFGGFEDFRGSSAQLWQYDLVNERWELRNLNSTSACHPEARHNHSAVVFGDQMYVYGGLSNLKPLGDLWRWSWREKRWFKERTRGKPPGPLHGHTAIQAFGSMFVFGGERNGRTTRGLWRLNLTNMSWQKIRAKGPRPNPITWHGAIANPLSMLDEANYIVEGGDPELLKTGIRSLSEDCFTNHESQDEQSIFQYQSGSPAKSRRPEVGSSPVASKFHRSRRSSRLGFLRQSRGQKPTSRSSFELKEFSSPTSNTMVHPVLERQTCATSQQEPENSIDCDTGANSKILADLDTDIKQMFERALSPDPTGDTMQQADDDNRTASPGTSRSIYHTAIQGADSSASFMQSQRTSCAFTTPASSMQTLKNESTSSQLNQPPGPILENSQEGASWLASSTPVHNSNKRRPDRPKSEIVQSLIDRADARIKHLYTPYFQPDDSKTSNSKQVTNRPLRNSSSRSANRHSLDKSKRHTIHQTMTYYSLCFSDDKNESSGSSENSPPDSNLLPSDNSNTSNSDDLTSQSQVNKGDLGERSDSRMTRDDLSSSTIKGYSTNGIIVGVRGASQLSQRKNSDQSLDTNNSSESKTLCAGFESNSLSKLDMNAQQSSNDTTMAHGPTNHQEPISDNTSMSFSVIAEFEEDDMLQYSSPTDPKIQPDPIDGQLEERSQLLSGKQSKNEPMIIEDELDTGNQQAEKQSPNELITNKSSSSGYNSFSGPNERSPYHKVHLDKALIRQASSRVNHNHFQNQSSDTQEDSSVRTESSLGFTTTETSPEQSALKRQCKRMKVKTVFDNFRRIKSDRNNGSPAGGNTLQSATIDSLAFPSDCSDTQISDPREIPSNRSDRARRLDKHLRNCSSVSSGPHSKSCPIEPNSISSTDASTSSAAKVLSIFSGKSIFGRSRPKKKRYWQLCMLVIGGKQGGMHGVNEPITIWRLYI